MKYYWQTMKRQIPAISFLFSVVLIIFALAIAPGTANGQAFETDREFENSIKADIRQMRRRIEKFRKELTGEDVIEPGQRSTGLYPGIISRLQGLEKRCDFQEEYVRRMTPSSMRSPYEVQRDRQAVRDDIRNVGRELSRIKKDMGKIDEEAAREERERLEREALEEEIMKEKW